VNRQVTRVQNQLIAGGSFDVQPYRSFEHLAVEAHVQIQVQMPH
jgi:hypothetical protein